MKIHAHGSRSLAERPSNSFWEVIGWVCSSLIVTLSIVNWQYIYREIYLNGAAGEGVQINGQATSKIKMQHFNSLSGIFSTIKYAKDEEPKSNPLYLIRITHGPRPVGYMIRINRWILYCRGGGWSPRMLQNSSCSQLRNNSNAGQQTSYHICNFTTLRDYSLHLWWENTMQ